MFDHVNLHLEDLMLRISQAASSCGRDAEDIKLVAVSKNCPAEAITAAYQAGQRRFGENRVQELAGKAPALPDDIEWHLIGHLQSNKAAAAIRLAKVIESVDSIKLLDRLGHLANESGVVKDILLEFNISGEDTKFGARADNAEYLVERALHLPGIRLIGMMTMAPYGADECELRKVFSGLRSLRDCMENRFGISLPDLSMGMSGDFETAIEEGATIVRIGSAIFR
ncbi:MAG: YggS family pyridoxal phosphate-dependent enzyme [Victivallales bacterium]|nr:YggS family pyridoxal phosphate-dependent enzyme [Victivallales bacterium]